MDKIFQAILGVLIVFVFISLPVVSQNNIVSVGEFSKMGLSDWEQKTFGSETLYIIEGQAGSKYLYASANNSASAIYKKVKVDLSKTPYLNWSWKIDRPLPELNEQTKEGDDYSARVYVIVNRRLSPWNAKALNYIWSSNKPTISSWPNAFTNKTIMIPLRTSLDANQEWMSEKVNVKVDFEEYFDIRVDSIDGVAIMVDSDNSGLQAAASFGDLYFSSN